MRKYTLLCEDRQARAIERLAHEFDMTQEAVLRQLLAAGLDSLDRVERID
ncbi:CopG family transcriptional regulator [Halomarina salina]|uniref:CopG family transcriptional regulator n=1 Tax=Halomarina salina TaxID=1872699 RepID=A0ABD5RP81_9EURY|nr:CopG family transcriptional regulator [Halomarina salina]